ncbi:MAG TPA: 2-dehydropantoate 2-reductase [Candidatus Polarisedimenticolaceae bacterium]|nr:2-dehydropantoate 2-reductase [Candidatus Polarisedimenticolaceae bacterium]
MSIAVVGVGGAGGYFGARLAQAGHDVVFIARGAHLAAIRDRGLTLVTDDATTVVRPKDATDDLASIRDAQVVILGVKSWQVAAVAAGLAPVLGRRAVVVPLQNGVETVDRLTSALGLDRVMGGLCGTITRVDGPGRIVSVGSTNFIRFGELDGRVRARTRRLRQAFRDAGISAEIPKDIHVALWQKFLFVVPVGGVGAFADADLGTMRGSPELWAMLEGAMREIFELGRARGVALPDDAVASALAFVSGLSPSGTSSLQRDIAAGRPSELDDWTGAVVRIGDALGIETPVHDRIYAKLAPKEAAARMG